MQNRLNLLKASSCLILLLLISSTCFSQKMNLSNDLMLIDSVSKGSVHHSEIRPYIYKNQPKTFKNSNPVSLLYGGSLYVYQNVVSQHLSASCLYDPSCSDFSKQAVKEYGIFKGTLLSLDRLNRCNRIAATGLNPGQLNRETNRFSDSVNRYK